jgi:hypothetical protein
MVRKFTNRVTLFLTHVETAIVKIDFALRSLQLKVATWNYALDELIAEYRQKDVDCSQLTL